MFLRKNLVVCILCGKKMINNIKEFKQIPRFRIKFEKDRQPIAVGTRALKGDHLYFYGPGKLALYYSSDTKAKANHKRKRWTKQLRTYRDDLSNWGDFDGILVFEVNFLKDIPRRFFRGTKQRKK